MTQRAAVETDCLEGLLKLLKLLAWRSDDVLGTRQRQRRENSVRLRLRLSRIWIGRTCALGRGLEGHLCVQAACKQRASSVQAACKPRASQVASLHRHHLKLPSRRGCVCWMEIELFTADNRLRVSSP
jgi:hypothetical protein